ncbi:5'-nucleotidase [Haloplasma contractile]|uniref:5'-nucleotidase protein n=1 Tax=Haloplasma contractile SSD-17B TaxID=1033810 RepID=U2DRL8_9MOLU|nr:5'-nucleotidase [Haloplasma contractile]ERJ11222.1 5'-nucleotidase protein [Haloplasma contractile SSD-17B]
MSKQTNRKLVVGISSRALFNLEKENQIFEDMGLKEYKKYQLEHENEELEKGPGFPLIEALLKMDEKLDDFDVEVMIISRNDPQTGLRVFNSIEYYGLNITRAAFTGGEPATQYLKAYNIDLFLSRSRDDVQDAINMGFAAGLLYDHQNDSYDYQIDQIRIAFDGDSVIFSDEAEKVYQEQGLCEFHRSEKEKENIPLQEGPFCQVLKKLSLIKEQETREQQYIRIAIVTARSCPAHKRPIITLRKWNALVDEIFYMGGLTKKEVLKQFNPHIFFDDQDKHLREASEYVPSVWVPYCNKKQ